MVLPDMRDEAWRSYWGDSQGFKHQNQKLQSIEEETGSVAPGATGANGTETQGSFSVTENQW